MTPVVEDTAGRPGMITRITGKEDWFGAVFHQDEADHIGVVVSIPTTWSRADHARFDIVGSMCLQAWHRCHSCPTCYASLSRARRLVAFIAIIAFVNVVQCFFDKCL